jgi:hypothetical protein
MKSLRWDWRLEANLNRKANGLALEGLLRDYTYLCWNLTPGKRVSGSPASTRSSVHAYAPDIGLPFNALAPPTERVGGRLCAGRQQNLLHSPFREREQFLSDGRLH